MLKPHRARSSPGFRPHRSLALLSAAALVSLLPLGPVALLLAIGLVVAALVPVGLHLRRPRRASRHKGGFKRVDRVAQRLERGEPLGSLTSIPVIQSLPPIR